MATSATVSISALSNIQGGETRERKGNINRAKDKGRRELLFSAAATVAQVTDSRTDLLKKYLKKSEENKTKNDKERLDSYYKRNYKDYFGLLEGTLKQKKEQLSESEKGILEWLEKNK
ncbi:uncharacterized protein [Coffea arabica]|uniref:Photosystem I reaction center subunit N, chloroplastic-like n=1 Tax=Coffea arabica TaxID=13443 RepID=A0A6P6W8C3_COFAR|nr:uncharacterized protein LOC113730642 isoform X1 [Coffea arabica]